jgi:formylglycine-generating enzyme required for sulfatase activity
MTDNLDLGLVPINKGGRSVHADFLIARHPVTVRDFHGVVGGQAESLAGNLTVKLATWDEAIRYCNRLSLKAGRPLTYDETTGALLDGAGHPARDIAEVRGFRLPTGSEWSYAAQGGRPDPPYADWGAVLDRVYWDDPSSQWANPVSPKEPITNAIGLVGMLGFVREWYSHLLPGEDCRNRACGWGHYFTNYDCFIAYHVTGEAAAEGTTHPFRIALTADTQP